MFVSIAKLLREQGEPLAISGEVALANRDLFGHSLSGPVVYHLVVTPHPAMVHLLLDIRARLAGECGRCLTPVTQDIDFENEFRVRQEDLADEFSELPFTPDGRLDIAELVYQELLLEIPSVLLCREDCSGLCQHCGKLEAECRCELEPEGDPRLQVLRDLLQDN